MGILNTCIASGIGTLCYPHYWAFLCLVYSPYRLRCWIKSSSLILFTHLIPLTNYLNSPALCTIFIDVGGFLYLLAIPYTVQNLERSRLSKMLATINITPYLMGRFSWDQIIIILCVLCLNCLYSHVKIVNLFINIYDHSNIWTPQLHDIRIFIFLGPLFRQS